MFTTCIAYEQAFYSCIQLALRNLWVPHSWIQPSSDRVPRLQSTLAESAGGDSMSAEGGLRLKRPESFESKADPGDSPLQILRDTSVPARSASLRPLRTCTRLSVVPFHTRRNQKGPAVPLLYVLTLCLHNGAHTATSNDWAISNMDGSHKYNLSEGS